MNLKEKTDKARLRKRRRILLKRVEKKVAELKALMEQMLEAKMDDYAIQLAIDALQNGLTCGDYDEFVE